MRLYNQHLLGSAFEKSEDLVGWMCAVQSQDYAGAKWAVASRLTKSTEQAIDEAVDNGHILRTHVLRPTWHFVLPKDIRWMVELSEPRIAALSAKYMRDLQLDSKVLKKASRVITKVLEKEGHLTRNELGDQLKLSRIDTSDLRLTFILFRAELDCLICSGARKGKQQTYALLEARAPSAKRLTKEEALHELATRYFVSRGPASLKDFTWWSGLSAEDARKAVALVQSELDAAVFGKETYFYKSPNGPLTLPRTFCHMLPAWDEYTVAYKDRSFVIDAAFEADAGHGIFNPNVMVNGKLAGIWRREIKKEKVIINLEYFTKPSHTVANSVIKTAHRYATFIEKDPEIIVKIKKGAS